MAISKSKVLEAAAYFQSHGHKKTCQDLNLKPDTLDRYLREAKEKYNIFPSLKSNWLAEIAGQYSDDELRAIAKGGRLMPGVEKVPVINFKGERVRIGAITDTHIGHKRFSENRLLAAFEEFAKAGVDFITHSGDVTEGMSHRAGHIYELDHIGYDSQKAEAVRLLSQWKETKIYAIDGNHDRWFIKSNGAKIVKDIAREVPGMVFLGHDEGDISLGGNAVLKLWHGEDGNSYALSYRLQKILESLSGGEKPSAMFAGHVHKYVNIFERNVYAVSVGCLEAQTSWMRSKRIAAHVGFAIIDLYINERGISRAAVQWFPFYH